ncbi:L,D-transpeptidase family protein [Clostridium sp. BJN0001]|uniref:L,D-transpeptidase family protein n=1 Tax=Clostridium sp. BJN0001 TaxID=2930219 RepID=UPI001FD4A023|nr:L,D-transpeptidase family protein [Clostridium sp. BJN0001]
MKMQTRMNRNAKKTNKAKKSNAITAGIGLLIAVYLGMSLFFINHFYFGTKIDEINVTGKTVPEASDLLKDKIASYKLAIKERGGETEDIVASDIDLNLADDGIKKIESLKNNQHAFAWPIALFSKKNRTESSLVELDEDKLEDTVDNLSCVTNEDVQKPQNASLEYDSDGKYKIVDEVLGNQIDKSELIESIKDTVLKGNSTLDITSSSSYVAPKYTKDSSEIKDAKDTMEKYVSSKITYTIGDKKITADADEIKDFLKLDENCEVTFDKNNVKKFVNTISSAANTYAKTRKFKTTDGNEISVVGGNYGWIVNKSQQIESLIDDIKKGEETEKEPEYSQKAFSHDENDIGNTYVELDLSKQHLWFYKDGTLITEGDVVTGNVSRDFGTPEGTYILNYKERNATLKGENYESKVTFWMPFNSNIGIHDASWRSEFGGDIYKTSGSHGCVNSPYELAQAVFESIEPGTAIVVYSEE